MATVQRTGRVVVDMSRSPHVRLRPVPVDAIRFDDALWAPKIAQVRRIMLPSQYRSLDETGRLANFRRGAGKEAGEFEGFYFNDSDVYKWLEAASWVLVSQSDPELDALVDRVIAEVGAAQLPDGYLDNFYLGERNALRWTELTRTHELYCAGHLFQSAVAHHRATGKMSLLGIATRFADLICDVFGPEEEGKQPGTDGHEEIELALVELSRETGNKRYLEQARYFVDARGYGLVGGDEYHQDHVPLREMDAMVGHAVRAVYLNAGAADVYAEMGDSSLLEALEQLWTNMVERRMYVTGGIGARHEGEAFGADFELPNSRAYAETCAAIGSVMWNWRMLLLTGEARYADLIEHTLYNAVIPGVSLDGSSYFYENPLESDGNYRREPWFACACCPPNVARTLASLPGYVYSTSNDEIWVHLYAAGTAEIDMNGQAVRLEQRGNYPWDGVIELVVGSAGEFALQLRIPGWCENGAAIAVNGEQVPGEHRAGSYVRIARSWQADDIVRLTLPMSVRLIEAHPYVEEASGRVAVMRGPILYCTEQADNPDGDLRDLRLMTDEEIRIEPGRGPLAGMPVLVAGATISPRDADWDARLYRTRRASTGTATRRSSLTLVPYFAWANRDPGRMTVWVRVSQQQPSPGSQARHPLPPSRRGFKTRGLVDRSLFVSPLPFAREMVLPSVGRESAGWTGRR